MSQHSYSSSYPRRGGSSYSPSQPRRGRGSKPFASGQGDARLRLIDERSILSGLGGQINAITVPLASTQAADLITDVETVASFSWLDSEPATIVVPGSPPFWVDVKPPFPVRPDSGVRIVDHNTLSFPSSPIEPLFRATLHLQPEYDFLSCDMITNRNNIRKLFSWGAGVRDDFRIDVDVIGTKTVILTRWEKAAREEVLDIVGYNEAFEEYCTVHARGFENTSGHSQIVSYMFGDTKMLVTFDVDACIRPADSLSDESTPTRPTTVDDLAGIFAQTSSSGPGMKKGGGGVGSSPIKLSVKPGGKMSPTESLIKIKTRGMKNPLDATDVYLQLRLGGTRNLFLGKHSGGMFAEIQKLDFGSAARRAGLGVDDTAFKQRLSKLSKILTELRRAAMQNSGKKMALVCGKDGQLSLMERMEREVLSEDLLQRFAPA